MSKIWTQIAESKKMLAAIGALAGNLPGLTLIATNILLLPGDTRPLYLGIQASLTAVILMILFIKSEEIQRTEAPKIIQRAKVSFGFFFTIITLYIILYYIYVRGQYVFPFFPGGDLKDALAANKGISGVLGTYLDNTQKLLNSSTTAIAITRGLFWILYACMIGTLVYSLALLTIYIGSPKKTKKNGEGTVDSSAGPPES